MVHGLVAGTRTKFEINLIRNFSIFKNFRRGPRQNYGHSRTRGPEFQIYLEFYQLIYRELVQPRLFGGMRYEVFVDV